MKTAIYIIIAMCFCIPAGADPYEVQDITCEKVCGGVSEYYCGNTPTIVPPMEFFINDPAEDLELATWDEQNQEWVLSESFKKLISDMVDQRVNERLWFLNCPGGYNGDCFTLNP